MTILDKNGKPYDAKKPVMDEVATARRNIDIYTGWLQRLENPDPVLLTESAGKCLKLYDEVARDAHAGSVLQTRALAVTGKEWQVEPASDSAQDQEVADFVQKGFAGCNFDQGRQELLKGILYGFYVGEIMWAASRLDGKIAIVPSRILAKHPKRFTFSLERELRLLTPYNQFDGEPVPERKFVVFTYGSSDNPYGEGLGQRLWWPVWFKKNGIKFWLVFLEKFGSPTVVGKYPAGTGPDEKRTLLDAIDAIQQETGISIPDTLALEFLEAERGGRVDYQVMCEYMDKQISKAVLGQTATTEGTPGKLGNEDAQENVRGDIVKADADLMCECLNNGPVRWLVDYNFVVDAYPKMWIRTEPEEDLKSLSERDKTLVKEIGLPVGKKYFYDTYGIPEPEPGEETVGQGARSGERGAREGKDNAEFAEGGPRFDPDQEEIEDLADRSIRSAAKRAMSAIDAPIRKLIEGASSLEEVRDRILDLYEGMDGGDLERTLADALVTAALHGATANVSRAETQRRRG